MSLGCTHPALQDISHPHTTTFLSGTQPGHSSLSHSSWERSQELRGPRFSLGSTHLLGWNWLGNIPAPESIPGEDKRQHKARAHRAIPGSVPKPSTVFT